MKFTYAQLRIEAERELRRRKRDFPGKVARGRIYAGEAKRWIALQEAIVATLTELEKTQLLL
jgi:hypothetical protein